MTFEKEELDLYDEYLTFIRRKVIDDFDLKITNPYDLDIEIAEATKKGMKFLFKYNEKFLLVEEIDYHLWYKMWLRSQKLNQLGL